MNLKMLLLGVAVVACLLALAGVIVVSLYAVEKMFGRPVMLTLVFLVLVVAAAHPRRRWR